MRQVAIAPDQVRDPFEKNVPGIGVGRDGCRTPMQWNATAGAGFSTAAPWLPLAEFSVTTLPCPCRKELLRSRRTVATATYLYQRVTLRTRQKPSNIDTAGSQ